MPDKDNDNEVTTSAHLEKGRAMSFKEYDRNKIKAAPELKEGDANPVVDDVQNYLKHYGYLPPDKPNTHKLDDATTKALEEFQKLFKVPSTGELDEPTKKAMAQPRCGFPDVTDPLGFSTAGPWNKRSLKYAFGTLSNDVTAAVARAAVRRAFDTWTNCGCSLTFTEVASNQTHDIFVEWRPSNDPDHSMVGGVLAHADFPPGYSIITAAPPLPLHFDDQEHKWVDGAVPNGYDIETVALHEIGHLLGMYHSDVAGSVMYPTVSDNHTKRALTADDLGGIKKLYPPLPPSWENMGGVIQGEVSVVSWAANRLDLFVRGTDNKMYHKWWNGSAWGPSLTGWESLGGNLAGVPCAVSWGPNRLDIFARGPGGELLHKWWSGSAWGPSLTGWETLGTGLTSDPVAVCWGPNRLDVFARGPGGAVVHKWWNGSAWGPSISGLENMGGVIQGEPSVVAWGPNRLDVFVRGTDNAVWHKAWNGSQWKPSVTGWESLGGVITSDPVAVAWGPNRLDIFVRGTNGAVFHKWWNGSAWGPSVTGWENMGGVIQGKTAVAAWSANRLDLFVRGTDNAVWHKWWNGSSWGPSVTGWESLGGVITADIAVDAWAANRLDVFVRGTNGGVYHKWWNGSKWGPA